MSEKQRKGAGADMIQNAVKELKEQFAIHGEVTSDLNQLRSGKLPELLKKSIGSYIKPRLDDSTRKGFYVIDPIYGSIFIEAELAPIVLQPIVQRLKWISQLSFAYMEYPAATHSRLSHSFGVARNVDEMLTIAFKRNRLGIGDNVKKFQYLKLLGKTAALVHDLGHGPFGHALDKYAGLYLPLEPGAPANSAVKPDKYFSVRYIGQYLKDVIEGMETGIKPELVQLILTTDKKDNLGEHDRLISDMVDSTLDADRMDYLVRDAHMTGIPAGRISASILQQKMIPFKNEAGQYTMNFEESSVPDIDHFLYARQTMYIKCYEESKKLAGEGMLIRAVHDFNIEFRSSKIDPLDLLLLTDSQLLDLITMMTDQTSLSNKLATMLKNGVFFVQIYDMLVAGETNENTNNEIRSFREGVRKRGKLGLLAYKQFADSWREQIGGDMHQNDVIVVPPFPETFELRDLDIGLVDEDGNWKEVVDVCNGIKERTASMNDERPKIRVYANPELPPGELSALTAAAKRVLGNN